MASRRRGRSTGPFAGLSSQPGSGVDLHAPNYSVLGIPAIVFRDDDAAAHIDSEEHLLPWFGDKTLLVDRYDGRLLLDDLDTHTRSQSGPRRAARDDVDEELLDEERYRDLDYDREHELELSFHAGGLHDGEYHAYCTNDHAAAHLATGRTNSADAPWQNPAKLAEWPCKTSAARLVVQLYTAAYAIIVLGQAEHTWLV
jgi:hypothetical protein